MTSSQYPSLFTDFDHKALVVLAALLLGVYLLAYVNNPISIDGDDTLDVAATMVLHGVPAATQMTTPRQLIGATSEGEQYLISPDGERYSKKGVVPSLLLIPLIASAHALPWLSIQAAAMLLNSFITTATALLLYRFVRRLGGTSWTAIWVTLIFGLATLSAVYAPSLFGEPLAGFLLLAALFYAWLFRQDKHGAYVWLAGGALALALGVNLTYTLMIPVFGVYMLWGRFSLRRAAAFVVPFMVMGAFLAAYNWLRFGSIGETGYYLNSVESFSMPLLLGLYGLWISVYKGFFWFNPALLLAIPGWWWLRKQQNALALTGLALIAVQSVTYGMWWAWDGAWCWGPRFLLPVIPVMALFLIPVIERAAVKRWLAGVTIALAGLSMLIQGLGILVNFAPFYQTVYNGNVYDPQNNMIFTHARLLFAGHVLQPAWLVEGVDWLHLLAVLGLLTAGGFAALRLKGRARLLMVILAAVMACNVVVARQQTKSSYQFVQEFERVIDPPGTVFAATFDLNKRMMDVDNGSRIIVTNPNATEDNPLVRRQFEAALARGRTFWYVTWLPSGPDNWFERELWQRASFVTQRTVAEHRALWFDTAPAPEPDHDGGWRFGIIRLNRYGFQADDTGIHVSLEWMADDVPDKDYGWFVHLLNPAGEIVQQQDRQPQGSYAPTSQWQPGQAVMDRLFFPLTDDTDLSGWRLRIGYVDPADGARLPAFAPDDSPLSGSFVLVDVAS